MKARFVRQEDVKPYSPANHSGTKNYRVISNQTVGAENMEVLIGVITKGEGAAPHLHPNLEQTCYVMGGTAVVEVGGERRTVGEGDFCFFPKGEKHVVIATSDEPLRLLVIYAPPYEERADRVQTSV